MFMPAGLFEPDGACGNAEYDLVSVIAHHGSSLTSGHYTAFVLCGGSRAAEGGRGEHDGHQWYHCDDTRVTPVSAETVQACEAYVLCYERRQSRAHAHDRHRIVTAIEQHAVALAATPHPSRHSTFALSTPSLLHRTPRVACVHAPGIEGGGGGEPMQMDADDSLLLSRGWFGRYMTTLEPGPVTHSDALCQHDALDVFKVTTIHPHLCSPLLPSRIDSWRLVFEGGGAHDSDGACLFSAGATRGVGRADDALPAGGSAPFSLPLSP